MAKTEARKDTIRLEASEIKDAFECLYGSKPFRGLKLLSITADAFDGVTAEVEPSESLCVRYPVMHRVRISNGPDGPVYEDFAVLGG